MKGTTPLTVAWRILRQHFAAIFVAVVYLWSVIAIVSYRRQQTPEGVTVTLRIGHWQLEAGVREALKKMAEEYHKRHPKVMIVQDAIPEGSYGTWMTTQLMGGTAPDMIEVGLGVPYNVLLGYMNRYFLPLTTYLNQPNPYNRGTAMESVPWRKTYKDGMRGSYKEELQEYMTVPLAQFGIRIFYNKDLLEKLTGQREAPRDYRDFLHVCEIIKRQRDATGKPYTPLAGSGYHTGMWDGFMSAPLTYGAVRRVDYNRDSVVGNDELFTGFKTGEIGFDFAPFKARFQMLDQLTDHFQPGFTGLGRDDAVFLFAQQRAVFMTTGTWDAGSLMEQARGIFEIGVMDFPIPSRDDPEFGNIIEGPTYERPASQFEFAITRSSRHPEVALDFMRFIASQPGNQELNRIIGWIPAIQATSMTPLLRAFEPHLEGIFPAMPIDNLGGETSIRWSQLMSLFQVKQIEYEQLAQQMLPFYLKRGAEELAEANRNRRRGVAGDEQFIAGFRARAMAGAEDRAKEHSQWIKYRQITSGRLITRNLNAALLSARLSAGVSTNGIGPYEFSPDVIATVRARLQAQERKR